MGLFKKWFGKNKSREETVPETESESVPDSHAAPIAETLADTGTGTGTGTDTDTVTVTTTASEPARESTWALLKKGLTKTRKGITGLFSFRGTIDDDFVDELEAQLFAADFGPATVAELVDGENGVRTAWKEKTVNDVSEVRDYLKKLLREILHEKDSRLLESTAKPTVILVAGVNGTGKTTSIAKLANLLKSHNKTVILAAADTFRAAAVEQLTIWSERLGFDIVTGAANADPASVAHRAAEEAIEKDVDYLIVDTAGRLHTQKNLMKELEKIRGVLGKKIPDAPHECLLVLDATTGQNALVQAESFLGAIQISGIVLTKLDGTAKGGIVVTINNRLRIPVKFLGVGEGIDDLQHFDAGSFVEALLEEE